MKKNKVYTVYKIAKIYYLRPKMLHKFCREMGYLNEGNMPTKKAFDEGLCYAIDGRFGYKACFTKNGMNQVIKDINDNIIVMLYLDAESNLSASAFERIVNRRPLQ